MWGLEKDLDTIRHRHGDNFSQEEDTIRHRHEENVSQEGKPSRENGFPAGKELDGSHKADGHKHKKKRPTTRADTVMSVSCHVITTVVTWYFARLSFASYSFFSWHPALAAIGCMFLMVQGIMVISKHNVYSRGLTRDARVRAHWVLLTISTVLALASFAAIVVSKNERNKRHFTSIHSVVGLLSVVLVVLSSVGGVPALYASQLKSLVKPSTVKFAHVLVGIVTFVFIVACFISGLYTNFFRKNAGTTAQVLCAVAIILVCVLTLANSATSAYRRIRRYFRTSSDESH